jgi:hypothetical protein
MPENFDRYTDPFFVIPLAVMGVILFCVIHRIVGEMEIFAKGTRTPMAVCITFLSLYGFDRATVGGRFKTGHLWALQNPQGNERTLETGPFSGFLATLLFGRRAGGRFGGFWPIFTVS